LTGITPGAFAGLSLVSSDFSVPLFYSLAGDMITVGGKILSSLAAPDI